MILYDKNNDCVILSSFKPLNNYNTIKIYYKVSAIYKYNNERDLS